MGIGRRDAVGLRTRAAQAAGDQRRAGRPGGRRRIAARRGLGGRYRARLGRGKLAAIDAAAGGKSRWEIDFPKLPTLEVVRGNDDAAGAAVPIQQPNNGQIILPNGVIVNNRGGGRVRVLGGGMVIQGNVIINGQQQGIVQAAAQQQPPAALPGQPVPPQPGGGEQVADVRPVGDRVLVATTTGRVVSLDLTDGKVAWQTRLADGMPDRLVATEDFTVVKVSDDLTIRLFALDTFTGKLLGSKAFSRQGTTPVNLALAADGTLVYTMPDRLCLKDLYKISQNWDEDLKSVNGPPNVNLYAGATQPGQLLISEGRILALADSGGMQNVQANIKYVRVHSLETGQPVQLKYDQPGDGKHQVDLLLTSGTRDWNVLLRTVGSHLYVVGPQSVYGYNLDDPAENWKGAVGNGIGAPPRARRGTTRSTSARPSSARTTWSCSTNPPRRVTAPRPTSASTPSGATAPRKPAPRPPRPAAWTTSSPSTTPPASSPNGRPWTAGSTTAPPTARSTCSSAGRRTPGGEIGVAGRSKGQGLRGRSPLTRASSPCRVRLEWNSQAVRASLLRVRPARAGSPCRRGLT